MNQATFVGRIVRPVKVGKVGSDSKVVNNVIAVSRRYKNKRGDVPADFIPFVAWNYQAEILERFCTKGQQIAITGKMQSRSYQDKEEVTRYRVELIVDEITLLARHKSQDDKAKESDQEKIDVDQLTDTVNMMVKEAE